MAKDVKGLIHLVREKDFNAVQNYLNEQSHKYNELVALTDMNGWTAVHHASYSGQYDILKLLLKGSSSEIREAASRRSHTEETPLIVACQAAVINVDVVHHLLSIGVDPNTQNRKGSTAMHFACESGHPGNLTVVKLLKDMGASVNVQNYIDGCIPLQTAIPLQSALRRGEDLELVRYLLRYSQIRWKERWDPLVLAITYMEEAVPDVLKYADEMYDGYVTCALKLGKVNIAVQLLEAGFPPNITVSLRRLADVVYSSLETFEALIGAFDSQYFDVFLPFVVLDSSPQETREIYLRGLLRQIAKKGLQYPIVTAECAFFFGRRLSGMSPENLDLFFKYFPLYDLCDPELRSVKSYKAYSRNMEKCLPTENIASLYKYFPPYDDCCDPELRSVKSLKDLCRPVVRNLLVTVKGDVYKALCWLESSTVLPSHIRKFLLYNQ